MTTPTRATTPGTSPTPPTPATTAATPATIHSADALRLTLDPVPAEGFFADYWEQRPLIVERDEDGRFDALLSAREVERIVCETGPRTPAFRLVRDGAQLPLSGYTQDVPWRPGAFSGLAVVDRVAAEHARGATLVLQALHLHHRPTALYCRGLEQRLGFPVQANAYQTPASAQGFGVHHDTHDVFVLQVSGTKRWRIYEPVVELPLPHQRWSPALGDPGPPCLDLTLRPGDTLYLPRGWPHEAVTDRADSLHITVGLHPPTRLDALKAALDAAGDDVELRRSLPPSGELPAGLLEHLAARLAPEEVARRARRRFAGSRRAVVDDQLTQARAADGLGPHDPVERRATVIAALEGPLLVFEGKELEVPARAAGALAAAVATDGPFTAAGLPGPLDEAGRTVLVRRLVREGFLRVIDP